MTEKSPRPVSRRQMIQMTAAGLLTGAAAETLAAPVRKRVIVIGGGIGGLSCAYELMERGHEVTVLEAARRTGGHVKTIHDPLPDGLYADVGAEHFYEPGYVAYRHWVRKFGLPTLEYGRRRQLYRRIRDRWCAEAELADAKTQREFGFSEREIAYMQEHGWSELPRLYTGPMAEKVRDEYDPLGAGLNELDQITAADWFAGQGASDAALQFASAGRRSSREKPPVAADVSALYRLWKDAVTQKRGQPVLSRNLFRLEGGNQRLPDAFAERLGHRIRKKCTVVGVEHSESSVAVSFTDAPDARPQTLKADYAVFAVSPLGVAGIDVKPGWPAAKRFALENIHMSMGSRVVLQARTRFWEGDSLPSINLVTGDNKLNWIWECATEVPGDSCVLLGGGRPVQNPEETLAAFRAVYPGKNKDTIERCIVHQWWKEEPTAVGCERGHYPLGQLPRMWPHLIAPVGRLHFVGAAYDALPHGQDAATLSARRAAAVIDAA